MREPLILFILLVALSGCATLQAPTEKELRGNFDSQIGRMSYDDAISFLGSPSSMTSGMDVFVTEWYKRNEIVFLTFDKNTGLLRSWSYTGPTKSVQNVAKEALSRTAYAVANTHFGD